MRSTTKPRLLLFDLGGVLVDYTGARDLPKLVSRPFTPQELHEKWLATDVWLKFELGQVTPEAFAETFARDWPLNCSAEEFLSNFESWTSCIYPGASELLAELRPQYRLAALSNSNLTHWRRNNQVLGVSALFERAFSSHEMGLRKPDPKIYGQALSALAVSPAETAFFDDHEENVAAARDLGLTAYRVRGIEALRACLTETGLLPIA